MVWAATRILGWRPDHQRDAAEESLRQYGTRTSRMDARGRFGERHGGARLRRGSDDTPITLRSWAVRVTPSLAGMERTPEGANTRWLIRTNRRSHRKDP